MSLRTWWQNLTGAGPEVLETAPAKLPERAGYEFGIGPGGLTETNQGIGVATRTDRRSSLNQLYDAYLACPWAWASVNAIARTITAGGLVTDWDNDDGQGGDEQPDKPREVLLLERMLAYCNPRENIRQILRGAITDLLVYGDAFIEVVWLGHQPVALYSLDCPSMLPIADEHGTVTGYVQLTELGQRATFEPREVIHISLDSPRSGIFGVSPTQAALLPITAWLFAAATSKEIFRKGAPPQIHVDFPAGASAAEINRWNAQYQQRNIG
ncbi:phage portal protein, partial [Streptomyces triculaminicus]|uniref:phage portal protein n=1 Tax=Streptomyces triculaminicus TaxID=2816232 RepID=UPI00379277F4